MTIDRDKLTDRILEVLEENESNFDDRETTSLYEMICSEYPFNTWANDLLNFAERYGVSVDWLLGRSEKYWL